MRGSSPLPPNRTRIVHVAQSIAGGVGSFLEEIAPHQAAQFGQNDVYFVVPAGSEVHLPCIDSNQLIFVRSTSRTPAGLLGFAREARAAIRRLRPDIVHLHSSYAGALARPLLGVGRPRIVYCPHGWAFAMETPKWKKYVYAAIERVLAISTDVILVNSQAEHDVAMGFGLPPQKIRVVRNGIAWARLARRDKATGPLRVGFIGRHDRQKGLDILLDTIGRVPIPNLHFEIVGESVVERDGCGRAAPLPNVTFHGWMTRARTLEMLNSLDAVVMPSRWDAAPMLAIEAMRAGVPLIASNRGGLPEIVQHGVGGYIFDLSDPTALAVILQGLERSGLERLGRRARARWEREYVADRMNQLTCEAYEQVLAGRDAEATRASHREPREGLKMTGPGS